MKRFEGKVVLITGAASGIGRAACQRFASEGAAVFGVDVSETGLAETEKLVSSTGGKIRTARFDITSPAQCRAAVDAAVAAFGRLDVLGNVAGVLRFHEVPSVSEEDWNRIIGVNLTGPFFLAQAAIPHLLETAGNIINIASVAGLKGQAYTVPYCASKGGVVNMTRALAMEYVKTPVRINAICPGGTKTNIATGLQFPPTADMELVKRYMGMRGVSEPEELAAFMAFVASDEAKSIHGAILTMDLGMTAD